MSETELLHLVGRGRAMEAETGDDLVLFTVVIGDSGTYRQVTFLALATLTHDLTIFEDDSQVFSWQPICTRSDVEPKRFRLIIEGNLVSDGNTYLKIQTCESPHGVGKDDCGRDLKEN